MTITNQMEIRAHFVNSVGGRFEVIANEGKTGKLSFQTTGLLDVGHFDDSTWILRHDTGLVIFSDSIVKMVGGVGHTIIRLELL